MLAALVTTLSLLSFPPHFLVFLPLQVSWLGEEPVAGVWSEKGQVEVFALRRLLQVVDDAQALAMFLKDEQARVKPIFTFAGHMGEGFALDWSPRVPGESRGEYFVPGAEGSRACGKGGCGDSREGDELWLPGTRWFPDSLPQDAC